LPCTEGDKSERGEYTGMKKLWIGLCLGAVLALVAPVIALAAYKWYTDFTVTESNGTSHTNVPIYATVDNDYFGDHGYISPYWQSTAVYDTNGNKLPHMLTEDRTWFVAPSIPASSTQTYRYTMSEDNTTAFKIIVGDGGYVTIPYNASLDIEDNFTLYFQGGQDTSAIDENIIFQPGTMRAYFSDTGQVTFVIVTAGDFKWLGEDTCYVTSLTTDTNYIYAGLMYDGAGETGDGIVVKIDPESMAEVDRWTDTNFHYPVYSLLYDAGYLYAGLESVIAKINVANMEYVTALAHGEHYLANSMTIESGYLFVVSSFGEGGSIIRKMNYITGDIFDSLDMRPETIACITSDNVGNIYFGSNADPAVIYKADAATATVSDSWAGSEGVDYQTLSIDYYANYVYAGLSSEDVIKIETPGMTESDRYTVGYQVSSLTNDGDFLYAGTDLEEAEIHQIDMSDMSGSVCWTGSAGQNYIYSLLVLDSHIYAGTYTEPGMVIDTSSTSGMLGVVANGVNANSSIAVLADTTDLDIYIDDVLQDTIALSGASANISGEDIIFMSDATPYVDYLIIDIDGSEVLHYQPNTPIEGTTLPDLEGTQDGIITWGGMPAGITVVPGPIYWGGGTSTPAFSGSGWLLVEDEELGQPEGLFREGGEGMPGLKELGDVSEATGNPRELFILLFAYILAIVAGFVVFGLTHKDRKGIKGSLFLQALTSLAVLIIFYVGGDGVIPGWSLIPFGIEAFLLLLWRNPYNPATN
jgi:hypothetical protein